MTLRLMNCFVSRILLLILVCFTSISSYGQTATTEVIARDGDGIFTLLRRNGLDPAVHFRSFLELNGENIGKDNGLFAGKTYFLPAAAELSANVAAAPSADNSANNKPLAESPPAFLDYPLFGSKYSRVEVIDQQLKGAVYYLLAGHGGPDPGAIGKYGPYRLGEDEYAYDVTIRLARRLMEHSATVYMIIQDADDGIREGNILEMDKDETCYPNLPIPYSQNDRLRQRTAAVNQISLQHKGAYQRMLAIHVDSRSKRQNIDVFFYYHENSPSGKSLADRLQGTFMSKYAQYQPNRDYFGDVSPRSHLYVIKYSQPPAVFIELGNIMNQRDQRRFVLAENRQALANWITEGIIEEYKTR